MCNSSDALNVRWKRPLEYYHSIDYYILSYRSAAHQGFDEIQFKSSASHLLTLVIFYFTFSIWCKLIVCVCFFLNINQYRWHCKISPRTWSTRWRFELRPTVRSIPVNWSTARTRNPRRYEFNEQTLRALFVIVTNLVYFFFADPFAAQLRKNDADGNQTARRLRRHNGGRHDFQFIRNCIGCDGVAAVAVSWTPTPSKNTFKHFTHNDWLPDFNHPMNLFFVPRWTINLSKINWILYLHKHVK